MSLAAVLVTSAGILMAADSAATVGQAFEQAHKIQPCGPTSYVAVTGTLSWYLEGRRSDGWATVSTACEQLRRSPGVSVREQAEHIASALASYADRSLPRVFRLSSDRQHILATVVVGGFDGSSQSVVVSNVLESPNGIPPRFRVGAIEDHSEACLTLAGTSHVALALLGTRHPTLGELQKRREVAEVAAIVNERRPCSDLSLATAQRFFETAVEASFRYAAAFGFPPGVVNWPIDVGVITPAGVLPIQRRTRGAP